MIVGHEFNPLKNCNSRDPLTRGCCPFKEEHPVHHAFVRGWEMRSPGQQAQDPDPVVVTPEFWRLRIEWPVGEPIIAVFPSGEDCTAVLRRYNGYSKVSITRNELDDPARF